MAIRARAPQQYCAPSPVHAASLTDAEIKSARDGMTASQATASALGGIPTLTRLDCERNIYQLATVLDGKLRWEEHVLSPPIRVGQTHRDDDRKRNFIVVHKDGELRWEYDTVAAAAVAWQKELTEYQRRADSIPTLTPAEIAGLRAMQAQGDPRPAPSQARGLVDDVRDTAWRVGATQTVEAIKAALAAGTRTLSSAALKRHVKQLAASPWGSAALAAAASALLAIGAPEGGKRARLSEELRIKAMTDASNEAIGSLVSELSALLDGGTVATIIDSIELPPPEPTVHVDFSEENEAVREKEKA